MVTLRPMRVLCLAVRIFRRVAVVFALSPLTLLPGAVSGPAAQAAPTWAPAATAAIHPGVQTFTNGAQCTANFVFYDGSNVYIGQAAHCSGTGGNLATDGCTAGTLPVGTKVDVTGASQQGTMVYNSWATMQTAPKETNPDVCAYNDLALVQLTPADAANVNPSIPFWGGPTGLAGGSGTLETVYSYGNSELRLGLSPLSPKFGKSLGSTNGGWTQSVLTLTPGILGDSGSAFLNSGGQALGVLSFLNILPLAGTNGVGGLSNELDYLHAHYSSAIQLALGTEPFVGLPLP